LCQDITILIQLTFLDFNSINIFRGNYAMIS